MQREKAIKIVQQAILENELLDSDEYDLRDTFDSMGTDSLDLVLICTALEERKESKLTIDAKQINKIKTVNDLVDIVEKFSE